MRYWMSGLTIHPRSSNFWFRMVVPERHRGRVGKREINFSLGTSDRVKATALHAAEKAKWRQIFSDLDRERETDDRARAPKLVADTLMALAENNTRDDVVLALCKFISFRVVTSWVRNSMHLRMRRMLSVVDPTRRRGMMMLRSTSYRRQIVPAP